MSVYEPPASNLKVNDNYRGKPAKAIFFALLISMFGSIIGAIVVVIIFSIYWGSIGINAEQIESLTQKDTSILIAYLIESGIFSIWSGHYVAKKTNYQEYKYCVIMVVISSLIGALIMLSAPAMYSDQPLWYSIVGFICYPIMVLYGCWLFVKSKT